jgi:hypothetical protein
MGIKNRVHVITPLRGSLNIKTQKVTFANGNVVITILNFGLQDKTNSELFPIDVNKTRGCGQ